jgi:dipeptidase E
MRLYLSSYKFGNYTEELVKLSSNNKKVGVIMNAVDWSDDKERVINSLNNQMDILKSLGFDPEQIDLRNYFDKKEELKNHLSNFGMVWVYGGNTFVLKRAYEQSGFGEIIKEMILRDEIIYAGFSAGVVILSKSLKGLEIVDDPHIVPEGYKEDFNWEGLGILDYYVAVHYNSDHPESSDVDKEIEYCQKNNIPYKTLSDGEVIVINGEEAKFFRLDNISKSLKLAKNYLGKEVKVVIDRPLGSKHPKHDFIYEVNYGYIEGVIAPDGEELDAYLLGINEPVKEYTGMCIAIAHRKDNDDDKLIVVPIGIDMSNEEIMKLINFQEKWFDAEIIR